MVRSNDGKICLSAKIASFFVNIEVMSVPTERQKRSPLPQALHLVRYEGFPKCNLNFGYVAGGQSEVGLSTRLSSG